MKISVLLPLLIVLGISFSVAQDAKSELRTWTAVNGKEVEAEFVSNSDGQVSLKMKSGKVFKVPLDKLSKADQDFLKAKSSPKEPTKEETPVNPNLKYEVKDSAVTITGCDKKASGALTIPASIEGNPITSIGEGAFQSCTSLTSITIPDSVTSIGENAFWDCNSLTGITIPDSVTSIGDRAFYFCRSLTSIIIPDSVTSIGGEAFRNCSSLTNISFGGNSQLTSIAKEAFRDCSSLESITIPDSVTSISVTSFEWSAFTHCTSLTTIEVGAGNVNYTDVNGVLFNKEKTVLHTYPAGKTGANYTIPEGVTSIGDRVFYQCKSLTRITIPDSVTSIGGAFYSCTSLIGIEVGAGNVNYTDVNGVLFNKQRTELIKYPESKEGINYTIPDSITSIGKFAFYDCGLTAVTFLGDAPKISGSVFRGEATFTIYRKPEAKGWGDTWAGRPVKLISEKP